MMDKNYEVTGHYKNARKAVLDRFGTQSEALTFARDLVINYTEPESGDLLVSITVINRATNKILSTFYPDPYEAESMDDDDDG